MPASRNKRPSPRAVGGGRSPRYAERRAQRGTVNSRAPEWGDAAAAEVLRVLSEDCQGANKSPWTLHVLAASGGGACRVRPSVEAESGRPREGVGDIGVARREGARRGRLCTCQKACERLSQAFKREEIGSSRGEGFDSGGDGLWASDVRRLVVGGPVEGQASRYSQKPKDPSKLSQTKHPWSQMSKHRLNSMVLRRVQIAVDSSG